MVMSVLLLPGGQAGCGERAIQAAGVGVVGGRGASALADRDAVRGEGGERRGLLLGAGVEGGAPRVADRRGDPAVADGVVDEAVAFGGQLRLAGLGAGA